MQESWCELKKKKDFARSFPQNSPSSVWLDVMFAALSAVSRLSDSATEEEGGRGWGIVAANYISVDPHRWSLLQLFGFTAPWMRSSRHNQPHSAESSCNSPGFFFAPSLVFCQSHAKQRPSQASLCLGANEPALRYCCSDADNGGGCQYCPSASEAQTGPSARIQSLKNFVHPLDDYVSCVILVSI